MVRAVLDRDEAAIRASLAQDVVVRSPVTAYPFEGIDAATRLLTAVARAYVRYELIDDWRLGSTYVFNGRMWLAGGDVHLLERAELDADDRVRELQIYARPMAGTALFAAEVGPKLGEHARGAPGRHAVRALGAPLPALLRQGDKAVGRLLRLR
jgi:hypothetical protein